MTCSAVLERLGDYVDGELAADEKRRVEAHLRECTVCERFAGRYAGVVQAARDRLGVVHAVDDESFERVRAALALG
jgi:anti-sigma factor RsiW